MIDIQIIRDNPELVKEKSAQKGYSVDIDKLLELDNQRKLILKTVEELRQKRNEIASSMKGGGKPDQAIIDQGKKIKEDLSLKEDEFGIVDAEWIGLLKKVPNLPLNDVPVGSSEDENVILKEVGTKPNFDFTPKSHVDIATDKDWLDKERAAKVTGSRFAYIKGDAVLLQFALIQYTMSILTNPKDIQSIIDQNNLKIPAKAFVPVLPPVMIREEIYDQMDRLEPRDDRYHIDGQDDNLWLVGSAEHTMGSMYANEIIPADTLPIRYIGYSTSFRQEAGTYGKDTEGIIRMHQFDKLEMETFSDSETGYDEHLLMIALQEYMMQQLQLPYRVINKCTADIGKPNAHGVDIDAWMPGQNNYRETHTADYMTDYQSRRLKTRYKKGDSIEFVHTNDATAFAMGRTLIAILENYQTADGDVRVPDVLKPYMSGKELI